MTIISFLLSYTYHTGIFLASQSIPYPVVPETMETMISDHLEEI